MPYKAINYLLIIPATLCLVHIHVPLILTYKFWHMNTYTQVHCYNDTDSYMYM